MHIRPATRNDASAIADIWNPVIRDSNTTFTSIEKTLADLQDAILEKSLSGYGFYVAENAGGILGFATYGPFRNGPGYARTMEHSVFLAPNAKRKGIGKSLMAALEDHARSKNIHSLIAGLSADNLDAINFHLAIGYHEVARMPEVGFKFGRWHDLVLMQKLL